MTREEEGEPWRGLEILPVEGVREVRPGDDLATLLADAAPYLADGDVLVVTQKVVSKAEAQLVPIDPNDPDSKARIVDAESVRVLRRRGDLVISETRHGFVCANAGVDLSNVEDGVGGAAPRGPRPVRPPPPRRAPPPACTSPS